MDRSNVPGQAGSPQSGHWGPVEHLRFPGAALLFALGLLVAGISVPYGADLYDEGLIANGAALALRGQLPGASFYAPYPPGAFWALAIAFRLFGVRLIVERWLAAGLAALTAATGFWLVTRAEACTSGHGGARLGPAWLASLAATLLLAARWVTPVIGGALLLTLASGLALHSALRGGSLRRAAVCGGVIGGASLWRLDFGLYVLVASLIVWYFFAGWQAERLPEPRQRLAGAAMLLLGTLAVFGPPILWILFQGGHRAAAALFWWPITSTGAARLPWSRHGAAFVTPLAAVLLAVKAAPRLRREPARAGLVCWLLVLAAGFLTYALGRTAASHLLPLRVVSLLLASLCLEGGCRSSTTRPDTVLAAPAALIRPDTLVLLALVLANTVAPLRESYRGLALPARRTIPLPGARGAGVFPPQREARGYQWLTAYLDRHVPARGRLFCGAARHDMFLKDDNLAYFLSAREPGTYYWCLDAGVTSSLPVQSEMIRELEASNVQGVVIRSDCANHESNAGSRSSGVRLLDDYLRCHFQLAARWETYQVYRPRAPLLVRSGLRSTPRRREAGPGTFPRSGRRDNREPSRLHAGGTI